MRSQVLHHWGRWRRGRVVWLHYRPVGFQWRMVGLDRNRVVGLRGRMISFYRSWGRWWRGVVSFYWRRGWVVRLHWTSFVRLSWRWGGRVVRLHWRMGTVDGSMFVMVRFTRDEVTVTIRYCDYYNSCLRYLGRWYPCLLW